MTPRYFVLRLVRDGPLLPARLLWLDHEPGVPDNKLDRGRASLYPAADIGGEEVPPEDVTDRFHWPATHWKFAKPISESEYRARFDQMRRAEAHQLPDPVLRPRRRVDPRQVDLPEFSP
jgi:hypothetical protein